MEAELNIAEILKDKSKGTKLFDIQKSIEIEFDHVEVTRKAKKTFIWCNYRKGDKTLKLGYSEFGKERGWDNGMQILVPSRQMQDWSKFTWKRGDVLRGDNAFVMFDEWVGDGYSEFKSAFEIFQNGSFNKGDSFFTENFRKAEYDLSKKFVKKVESYYGGALNMETLAISKKEEFKPTDWCLMRDIEEKWKLCQFGFFDKEDDFEGAPYNAVGGNWYKECIPYNEETKHLLGTNECYKNNERG